MDDINQPRPDDWPDQPAARSDQPAARPDQPAALSARRRLRPGVRWAAGLGLAAMLVGGAVVGVSLVGRASPHSAGAVLTSNGSSPAAPGTVGGGSGPGSPASARSAGVTAGPSGPPGWTAQRADLRRCIVSARRLRDAGRRLAARARLRSCLQRYSGLRGELRLRLFLLARRAMHGQITFSAGHGAMTLAFERGSVQTASARSVSVKAPDGTTWTWVITSATIVIKAGQRTGPGALAPAQQVVVVGQLSSGALDARRVFILR